jgi:hypothetical protein
VEKVCLPPRRTLCGLAALRAKYFLFTLAKTQRRKEIVVHQKKNPASFKNKILWVKFN